MSALLGHLLLLLSSILSHEPPHLTTATRYADTVRDEGGVPACWRRCLRAGPGGSCALRFPDAAFDRAHPLRVAHRSLPCGTRVLLVSRSTGRWAVGVVLDRGPYGIAPGRSQDGRASTGGAAGRVGPGPRPHGAARARSADRGGGRRTPTGPRYRGDLDLSPRVADALGLSLRVGRMPVAWWVLRESASGRPASGSPSPAPVRVVKSSRP